MGGHPPPAPIVHPVPLQPDKRAGVDDRALVIFRRHKIPIEEKAHALYLHMAGLSF